MGVGELKKKKKLAKSIRLYGIKCVNDNNQLGMDENEPRYPPVNEMHFGMFDVIE